MSDETRKPPAPKVQVIRRPGASVVSPGAAGVVQPTPVAVRPVNPQIVPKPVTPTGVAPGPAPAAARREGAPRTAIAGKPAFRGAPPSGAPRPPPSAEAIAVMARRERVPNRIARGELEGKMKCRIWKKLHAEEAKRFDQAWVLVEANPGLDLADAFGVVQSGLSISEFMARRARARKREDIKVARATVEGATIDAFVATFIAGGLEAAWVLGERTVLDQLKAVQPISFELERSGKLEKLHLVALARKATWEQLLPTVERDPKLSHKPLPVARQPARRPVNDPREFLDHVGQPITVLLRNGISLTLPLLAVGPFDVLLGSHGDELFVPLHAMMTWAPAAPVAQAP